ncbi:hypothetical protein [Halonatronum saccharophilum]|uniref:hypothetical protein n=1 Tax=Halonatronum saccharophilum TaxID=150060 RepID=UPI00048A1A08|nr:hypothetical protein [Halonatronum saccharophilum]
MPRLNVKLKQHTPMIHFQAEQKGATLRATELKPKLDKFLIDKMSANGSDSYKKYLIGYKEGNKNDGSSDIMSLNYKVRVLNPISWTREKIDDKYPLFFANMGEGKDKEFTFCKELTLEFFSLKSDLIENIRDNLAQFLMYNNFGTRQSKGFGSFYIDPSDDLYEEKKLRYQFDVSVGKGLDELDSSRKVFEEIEVFYNSMRKGLNYNKFDPMIKKYCDFKKIKWDKQVIKERYFNEKKKHGYNEENLLMKDLFGLSVEEKWINQKPRGKISKEDVNENVTRFKSPILFKPIKLSAKKYRVYFEAFEINKGFLGTEFKIKNWGKGDLRLKIPEEFDFNDFFDYIFNNDINYGDATGVYKKIKDNYKIGDNNG